MPEHGITPSQRAVLDRIRDDQRWPKFERPQFLEELNQIACDVIAKGTIEGQLAALLVFHQLCDEMLTLLIDEARFLMQCCIFPAVVDFPVVKRKTTGQLLDILKQSMSFRHKETIVANAERLNAIRISLVHNLTKTSSLDDVRQPCQEAKDIVRGIFNLFWQADSDFRKCFQVSYEQLRGWEALHTPPTDIPLGWEKPE